MSLGLGEGEGEGGGGEEEAEEGYVGKQTHLIGGQCNKMLGNSRVLKKTKKHHHIHNMRAYIHRHMHTPTYYTHYIRMHAHTSLAASRSHFLAEVALVMVSRVVKVYQTNKQTKVILAKNTVEPLGKGHVKDIRVVHRGGCSHVMKHH